MNEYFNELVDDIISKNYSMVEKHGFSSIYNEKERIDNLDGDIVECGVYAGGVCVFLSKLFPNKKLWVSDSFSGFENIEESTHPTELLDKYKINEPHILGYPIRSGWFSGTHVTLEDVKSVFNEYGELDNPNVNFLKGYVKDTLNPNTCPIEKISLLRIDVDAYSATMDVLNYLYPKVVSGGIIIFDDSNIDPARLAIITYFEKHNIRLITRDSLYGRISEGFAGTPCYMIKE